MLFFSEKIWRQIVFFNFSISLSPIMKIVTFFEHFSQSLSNYLLSNRHSGQVFDIWTKSSRKLFLVAKLLYKSKCLSVCPSVRLSVCPFVRLSVCQPRLGGNVIFSAPNWDIAPFFYVQIPLINEHLFCKYFVRLSVGNATKGFATYGCFHPCCFYF